MATQVYPNHKYNLEATHVRTLTLLFKSTIFIDHSSSETGLSTKCVQCKETGVA